MALNLKYRLLTAISALCLITLMASAKPDDNIVLENVEEIYTIVASKDSAVIEKVKVNKELTFTAQRVDEKAYATEYYNSYISVDKASAPGTKPVYLSDIDDGIFYDDSKLCGLGFEVKKGKPATAKFELTFNSPEYFTTIALAESYYTRNKIVKIIVPQSLVSSISVVEKSFQPNIVSSVESGKKGERIYTYKVTNMEKVKREEAAPEISAIVPRIYVIGHFADCQALYRYLHAFTDEPDPGIEEVNKLAQELTIDCTTQEQRISRLTHWVQQYIRYIAVEHGEYGHRPDLASEVLRKRYGDCKGMSSLLKAMLIAVGIDARLAWIGTRAIEQDWSEVPSISSGNHMICSVVDGDSILFIDGTASYLPIGNYSYSIQGQQALIENGDTYMLHRVPLQSPDNNCDSLRAVMAIDGDCLVGTLDNTLSGSSRMTFCSALNRNDVAYRNDFLLSYMSYPRKNAEISNIKISGDSITDVLTTLSVQSREHGACQHLGDAIYVELLPLRTKIIETYDLKDRILDIRLPNPKVLMSDFTLAIPEGFAVDYIPEEYCIDNEWIEAHIAYAFDRKNVTCKASLKIKNTLVPLDRAKEWNKIARQFSQALSQQITLKKINL